MNWKRKIVQLSSSKNMSYIISQSFFYNSRISNFYLSKNEIQKRKIVLKSYPYKISLNTTNMCNYRCTFCEIHYFYNFATEKSGKISENNLDIDFIKTYSDLFKKSIYVELSGATGEPFLNPNLLGICKELKKQKVNPIITTNGSLLTKSTSEEIVKIKINSLLISIHSGDESTYQKLQGGNLKKIWNNLEYLIKFRNEKKSKFPLIAINCLLFKLNSDTIKDLIKKAKEIGIDSVNINQYYASRNKIDGEVSYYFAPEEGNRVLEDLYQYAKSIGQKITPPKPSYIQIESCTNNQIINCDLPWKSIKFKGCIEYEDSHYISVCNRILLFRMNYKEFQGSFLNDIWNHELVQYLRRTILKNPICQFCIDSNTPKLRCINNREYNFKRDKAIREFFNEAFKQIKIKKRRGIYLLNKNPYEYIDYYEKLNENYEIT